jgi:hypothetical protein
MPDEDQAKIKAHYAEIQTSYKNIEAGYAAIWTIEDSPPNMKFATLDGARKELEARSEERGTREHGEHGGDVFVYMLTVNDVAYKATVTLQWNRYDKQFYYLDDPTKVEFTIV